MDFFKKVKAYPSYGSVGIFTGCMLALDIASVRKLDYILVLDISNGVSEFWSFITRTLNQFTSRLEVLSHITEKYPNLFEKDIEEGLSWLSTEEQFESIRKIFEANQFAFLRIDFKDREPCAQIGKILKNNQLQVDVIYTSNIDACSVFNRCGTKWPYTQVSEIVDDSKSFLYISAGSSGRNGPPLRCCILN